MLKKIFTYRLIIWDTIYLLFKYTFIRTALSDKRLIKYLSSQNRSTIDENSSDYSFSPQALSKFVNRIFRMVYPNGNCLVYALIKRDILYKHGFAEPILIGLKNTNQGLKAHAWLYNEHVKNYKIVHILS